MEMRTPSPSPESFPLSTMSLSTDTKDLQMGDGFGDTKDMGAGVTDEVTISPTGAELAILANDAHRLVHSRL
jgi:hypothetical protein